MNPLLNINQTVSKPAKRSDAQVRAARLLRYPPSSFAHLLHAWKEADRLLNGKDPAGVAAALGADAQNVAAYHAALKGLLESMKPGCTAPPAKAVPEAVAPTAKPSAPRTA